MEAILNNQQEREALIKLMLLGRYTDNKLSIAEHEVFDKILAQLDWKNAVSEETFVNQSYEQVRRALQDEHSVDHFIEQNCATFSAESRPVALQKVTSVLMSDGLSEGERALLDKMSKVLGVS